MENTQEESVTSGDYSRNKDQISTFFNLLGIEDSKVANIMKDGNNALYQDIVGAWKALRWSYMIQTVSWGEKTNLMICIEKTQRAEEKGENYTLSSCVPDRSKHIDCKFHFVKSYQQMEL
jgi:hypothetical protein